MRIAKMLAVFLGSLAAGLLVQAVRGQDVHTLSYDTVAPVAVKHQLPLVTFVGIASRPVAGVVVAQTQRLPGYDAPAIVVSVPGGDWLDWRATLPATASDAQILAAVKGVQPVAVPFGRVPAADDDWSASVEALGEVNELRARHGLRPFIRDDGLTRAAHSAAVFRARRKIAGHCSNDFAAVPPESHATAAGCAAWEPSWGWGSCCDGVHTPDDGATHAGAAWALGSDGRRYMHLFVRR